MQTKTDMERIAGMKVLTCRHCGSRIEAERNRDLFGHCSVEHMNETRRRDELARANPFGARKGAI